MSISEANTHVPKANYLELPDVKADKFAAFVSWVYTWKVTVSVSEAFSSHRDVG